MKLLVFSLFTVFLYYQVYANPAIPLAMFAGRVGLGVAGLEAAAAGSGAIAAELATMSLPSIIQLARNPHVQELAMDTAKDIFEASVNAIRDERIAAEQWRQIHMNDPLRFGQNPIEMFIVH